MCKALQLTLALAHALLAAGEFLTGMLRLLAYSGRGALSAVIPRRLRNAYLVLTGQVQAVPKAGPGDRAPKPAVLPPSA